MFSFNHFNFNVFDLERSLKFYDEALGLKPVREKNAACATAISRMISASRNSTSPLSPTIWKKPMKSTPHSAAYAMKIPAWAYTSLKTPTATG